MSDFGQAAPELKTVEFGRRQLEHFGLWSRDIPVGQIKAHPIAGEKFEVHLQLGDEDGTHAVQDRTGLGRHLGVPVKLLAEYSSNEDLVKTLIRHSLMKRSDNVVRVSGNASFVTSIQKPDGPRIDPLTVFDIMTEESKAIGVQEVIYQRNTIIMRLVSERNIARPKKPGDVLHSGLAAKVNGRVLIGPFCYQMVCANGLMQSYERLEPVRMPEFTDRAIRDACQAQTARSIRLVESLVSLDEVPTENGEQILIQLGRKYGLSASMIDVAVQLLPSLPPERTVFDLISLLTRIIRDESRRDKLMQRVGKMTAELASHPARCSNCGAGVPHN